MSTAFCGGARAAKCLGILLNANCALPRSSTILQVCDDDDADSFHFAPECPFQSVRWAGRNSIGMRAKRHAVFMHGTLPFFGILMMAVFAGGREGPRAYILVYRYNATGIWITAFGFASRARVLDKVTAENPNENMGRPIEIGIRERMAIFSAIWAHLWFANWVGALLMKNKPANNFYVDVLLQMGALCCGGMK